MFFFQRGLFALALHARLSSAKRHGRAAPRRRRNRPRVPAGKFSGGKRVVSIPRESRHGRRWWGMVGADRGGEEWRTRVWDARKDGRMMVGQFPLAGEGKGVSCVVPAGRRDGGRFGSRGRAAGWSETGERLKRGELSHSAVATFLAGFIGASRHGGGPR